MNSPRPASRTVRPPFHVKRSGAARGLLWRIVATVSRETLNSLAAERGLSPQALDQIAALLTALAAEPDPHTTVSEPARALDIHIRDSLAALDVDAVRTAESIVDIGAGAGFPGLPLAIAVPVARVDLVEAASR